MLKSHRQIFEAIFMAADLFVVTAAWLVAYLLRFHTSLIPTDKGVPYFYEYLVLIPFLCFIWGFVFRRIGLYKPMRAVRGARELWLLIEANFLATLLFLAFVYLVREKEVEYSRLVFLMFGVLGLAFTVVERTLLRFILRELRRKGFNLRYLLVVGDGQVARAMVEKIRSHREFGFQLVGCLAQDGSLAEQDPNLPIVGEYSDLSRFLRVLSIDQVIIALPLEQSHLAPAVMSQIGDSLVDVRIVPDLHQFVSLRSSIEEFDGLPIISVRTTPLEGYGMMAKRVLDIVVASTALVILAPLLLALALLVKATSRGPMFYSQERVSVDGSRFDIFKFRTMYADSERVGPGWTKPNDQRVTPLGRLLRATSLDELPQLWNVLRGDMSIVGPRPERPVFIEEFRQRVPHYMLRHKVPAGMTGWAQVNGWRGDTSIDKRIEHDLFYIENWSILLDIKILLLTVIRGFRNRNAY